MSERTEAIKAWADYCRRFRMHPVHVIGCTYPGFERIRVDAKLAKEIESELAK